MNSNKPKILIFDVETTPIEAYVWGLFDQNIPINQIKKDWHLLSWAAKWHGEKTMMYMDQRKAKPFENDRVILKGIWKLLDEADVVIGQNSVKFDIKKLNARFVYHGLGKPSSFQNVDTLKIMRKNFAFTSNKLEYASELLNKHYKKQTKRKYAGFDLWKECLKGNKAVWKALETYNKYDVLATEELYNTLAPWDNSINMSLYNGGDRQCQCGSKDYVKNGYSYTSTGKYQRYECRNCGAESKSSMNLIPKDIRKDILRKM